MNLFELIPLIIKSKSNEAWVDIGFIANELSIDPSFIFGENTRLTSYWLKSWMCTDTVVGIRVVYLDDEPVMMISQGGRKCDKLVKWLSQEAITATHDYITSLIEDEAYHGLEIAQDVDFSNGYRISYNSQLMPHHTVARYMATDEIVKIVEIGSGRIDTNVTIEKKDGELEEVHLHSLIFPYHIDENKSGEDEVNVL